MATELVAGIPQLHLIPFYAQRFEYLRACIADSCSKSTTKSRGALMICNISDRCACGNHAKPRIEGSEFPQKRLKGWLT
jgi:hypothetical protein